MNVLFDFAKMQHLSPLRIDDCAAVLTGRPTNSRRSTHSGGVLPSKGGARRSVRIGSTREWPLLPVKHVFFLFS